MGFTAVVAPVAAVVVAVMATVMTIIMVAVVAAAAMVVSEGRGDSAKAGAMLPSASSEATVPTTIRFMRMSGLA